MEAIFRLIIVLGILVFVHEFGHFILAKLVGIRVERFYLGFPPRMFGKKVGETDYCVSWIPLGGYVKMSGMIDESLDVDSIKGESWEFMSKPVYQRALVILAGPVMNLILAVLLFSGITYVIGLNEPLGVVVGIMNSVKIINENGLQHGDILLSINEQPIKTWGEVQSLLLNKKDVLVEYERAGQILTTSFPSALMDSIQKTLPAIVGSLNKDFPAEKAGIQVGDRFISVNGKSIKTWDELTEIIHANPEQELNIDWERDGKIFSKLIIRKRQNIQGTEYGMIGVIYPSK